MSSMYGYLLPSDEVRPLSGGKPAWLCGGRPGATGVGRGGAAVCRHGRPGPPRDSPAVRVPVPPPQPPRPMAVLALTTTGWRWTGVWSGASRPCRGVGSATPPGCICLCANAGWLSGCISDERKTVPEVAIPPLLQTAEPDPACAIHACRAQLLQWMTCMPFCAIDAHYAPCQLDVLDLPKRPTWHRRPFPRDFAP